MEENENQRDTALSLGDIFSVLWKNKILVTVITLVVFAVGVLYTFVIAREQYVSSATFVVAIGTVDEGSSSSEYDFTNSLRLIETVASLVKEDIVLGAVAEDFSLDEEGLSGMISVTYSTSSFLISVSAQTTDADLSRQLADAVVEQLIYVADNLQGFEFLAGTVTQTSFAKTGVYAAPNKVLYLVLFFCGGLLLGCVAVFCLTVFSTRFKNTKDIEVTLGEKVIGYFLDDRTKEQKGAAKRGGHSSPPPALVEPTLRNFEPYNKLLTNIQYADLENPFRTIMITSSHEGELKSTVLCNLAACIARNGKRVCVVDLDMRRPVQHKVFGVNKQTGLVEYLEGSCDRAQIVKRAACGVDVVTAGKRILNPAAVIGHLALRQFLLELRAEYDYVLLDVPPVLACSDACSICKLCDGVVFNVTMNDVRKKEAAQALASLQMVGARIIGVNVTKGVFDGKGALYYYDGHYYGASADAQETDGDREAAFSDGEK